jgi:serine/threonine-protein kinase
MAAVAILVFLALRPQPAPPAPVVQATPQPVVPAPAPVAEAPAEGAATPGEEAKPEPKGTLRRRNENVVVPIPVPDGRVTLAIAPWGEVFVDGASRGVSPPLTQLSLPAGAHTIEIRNNSSPPLTVRVELKPGESISLQHRF